MGSGIGVGVDAMMNSPQVIYARSNPPTAKVTLTPVLTGARKGLMMSWRFSKVR